MFGEAAPILGKQRQSRGLARQHSNETVLSDWTSYGKEKIMAQHIKNVVLVHGAFADGSGWKRVAEILKNDGYKVSVAQPPETSYADDQRYTKAAIDAMGGPVVLVGHSYGGSIITEAGNHPNVAALIYIAAFALDEGESCASIEAAVPQASKAFKPDSNNNWWIDEADRKSVV